MIYQTRTALALVVGMALASGSAFAAVDAGQAGKLGKELTPIGATKAGNAEGTIPAWEGGITSPPANYVQGKFHPDPFAAVKPLFSITQATYKEHAE